MRCAYCALHGLFPPGLDDKFVHRLIRPVIPMQERIPGLTQPGRYRLLAQVTALRAFDKRLLCHELRDLESGLHGNDAGRDLVRFGRSSQCRQ